MTPEILSALIALAAVVAAAWAVVRLRAARAGERRLQAQLADLFERTGDLMIVHDPRGQVSTMNRAAEHASGVTREEAQALDPAYLFSASYLEMLAQVTAEGADAASRTVRAELFNRAHEHIAIEAQGSALVSDGRFLGVSVIARSTAERDQLEAQLRQAQKMEAVGRLATGIAHDFNNLITVLIGYSEELAEHVTRDSPLRKPVDEVRRAVERASGLTQQLLSFSRRHVAVAQPIDLNVTVSHMRELLRRLLGADVTLSVTLGRDLGPVNADPVQVGQVIMNLAVNARDAMPNGGTLAIETSRVQLGAEHLDIIPGPHVLLQMRDSGVGITPEVQKRLFEPFFTTKDAGHGTGLGLSMVQAIVRQSGGLVTVESELDKGTTFRVYFPEVEGAHLPAATSGAEAADTAAARGSGVVLLAEDDRAVRRLLSGELRRRGFTVLEARHGGEALEICRRHAGPIDLLLTDVVMPTMNGVDLVAAARPLRPDMTILFMSGHPERAGVGLDPQAAEAANLIMKPFTPDVVVSRINELINAKSAAVER